jgi:hypothetical protein
MSYWKNLCEYFDKMNYNVYLLLNNQSHWIINKNNVNTEVFVVGVM